MKIGIDLDGTIADNLDLMIETFNAYTGKNLTGEEIHQYALSKVYNISVQEFIDLMEEKEEEIITKSPIIAGAKKYVDELVKEGWEVHIITARNPKYSSITENWLQKKGIPYKGLHLLNSHDKLQICQELNVQFMIEDNVHNAYQLDEGGVKVILFEAPHNRHWPWQGFRCKTWDEIYSSIQQVKVGS